MDIELVNIVNAGEEYEYLLLKVNKDCNLNKFLVYDTTFDQDGNVSNKLPHMFRFPSLNISKDKIPLIRLYTCKNYKTQEWMDPKKTNNLILSWRLQETIWNKVGDKANLIEICQESHITHKK